MLKTSREVFPQYTTDLAARGSKVGENKCLDEYLMCAPLSAGCLVGDKGIFTGHTVKVVDRFSGQEVELAAKHCQFTDLGILRLGRGLKSCQTQYTPSP